MTISGKLLVERGSYNAPSQDWGEFSFLSLPSPGDRIEAQHEGGTHFLTILCVHHRPVALGKMISDEPRAEIVAKWTGKRD
ncbi:hypothetical protein [Pseudopontixanthobacter vadosimaris]|uniref:hypothetical protein n=1 Tax=Pseudopontixanthobacter vadosimaris TaxID=2726450 RepID=UPI00147359DE|nr:hypothetical protein [Pseudopontixanthobacter vadosimaris]